MKLLCSQSIVAKCLGIVAPFVSTRSTLPVLGNIAVRAEDDSVAFEATSLERTIRVRVKANVELDGHTTLPARLLKDVVANLPDDPLSFDLRERKQETVLACGRFTTTLKGLDYLDFPALPVWDVLVEDELPLVMEADEFKRSIERVCVSASDDASRPSLTGVEFEISSNQLKLTATDGFRLSLCTLERTARDCKIIIPSRSLAEVIRVMGIVKPRQVVVSVRESNNLIGFMLQSEECSVEVFSQLLSGKYPDYRSIIPKSYNTHFVCETSAMLRSVRMAMLFARDNANTCQFKLGKSGVVIAGISSEHGDGVSRVDATVEGNDLDIALDGAMLLESLASIQSPVLRFEFTTPTRPAVVRDVHDDSFLYVQMPMQPK